MGKCADGARKFTNPHFFSSSIEAVDIDKPWGREVLVRPGEVAVEVLSDFPEKFAERRRLSALLPDGSRRDLDLVDYWEHKGRPDVFCNVAVDDAAERLSGLFQRYQPDVVISYEARVYCARRR